MSNVRRLKPSEVAALEEAGELETPPAPGSPAAIIAERTAEQLGNVRSGGGVLGKPRTSWLIRGYLPARAWGAGYGKPGGGKSFHSLTLALELARGGRWAGQTLDPIPVLYVIAERPAVIADRQEAWTAYHERPIPDTFHEITWAPQLHSGTDVDVLAGIISALGIKFVVLDTLAQCTLGLEENAASAMSTVLGALNRLVEATDGGTVHVVHHTGKDSTKGMRGSSVLLGAADYTYELSGEATAIRVGVEKLNASTKPLPEWYKLDPIMLPPLEGETEARSGAVLIPTTGNDAGTLRAAELLQAIGDAYRDTGVTRADVEAILGCHRNTAAKALGTARDRGWLEPTGKGAQTRYYLTSAGLAELE